MTAFSKEYFLKVVKEMTTISKRSWIVRRSAGTLRVSFFLRTNCFVFWWLLTTLRISLMVYFIDNAVHLRIIFLSAEPRCLQGQAYKDNSGKFVTCSTNRAASSCPVNYECHYDGNMFGCCPSKGAGNFCSESEHHNSGEVIEQQTQLARSPIPRISLPCLAACEQSRHAPNSLLRVNRETPSNSH